MPNNGTPRDTYTVKQAFLPYRTVPLVRSLLPETHQRRNDQRNSEHGDSQGILRAVRESSGETRLDRRRRACRAGLGAGLGRCGEGGESDASGDEDDGQLIRISEIQQESLWKST